MAAKKREREEGNGPGSPPTKKGGFKGMDCPFSKADFLAHGQDVTMELELKPKKFGPGGYGFQKGGGITKVEADGEGHQLNDKICYVRANCIANVLGSKAADGSKVMSAEDFMAKAGPLKVTLTASPVEFSTGSFGWIVHQKLKETVDGQELTLQLNYNAPINGSKEKSEEEDPILAGIDRNCLKKHMATIGEATTKDDLTKIRGIGPWIEQRLNALRITSFKQISSMTSEVEDAVAAAIKHFPGRIQRDEWVFQAQKMVGGNWHELNPLVGNPSRAKVTIGGEEFEGKLIDIAKAAMADDKIEHFEAEALWFSASDGNKVTPLERKTLEYILTCEDYHVEEDAQEFLKAKIASLDDRGVISSKKGRAKASN